MQQHDYGECDVRLGKRVKIYSRNGQKNNERAEKTTTGGLAGHG